MEVGTLNISTMGLIEMKFQTESINSEYFMVRKAETDF